MKRGSFPVAHHIHKSIALLALCLSAACGGSGGSDEPLTADNRIIIPFEPTQTVSLHLSPTSKDDFNALVDEQNIDLNTTFLGSRGIALNHDPYFGAAYSIIGFAETPDGLIYYAYAGIDQDNPLGGSIVETGNTNYDATYIMTEVLDIPSNPIEATTAFGSITLTADFTNDTLSGDDGVLTVEATLNDTSQNFKGTVIWRGTEGDVEGLITDVAVLGAFQGSDEDTVFSGYFSGKSD